MRRIAFLAAILIASAAVGGPVQPSDAAEWTPSGLRSTTATLTEVLAASPALHPAPKPYSERHERWTYVHGERRYPVDVAVRGDDYRVDVHIGRAVYRSGRLAGAHWRADANGIAHTLDGDLQGDALDRAPTALFPAAQPEFALAGERADGSWAVAERALGDIPRWYDVAKNDGRILREMDREGRRIVVTTFSRFEPLGGALRAHHWSVRDGAAGDDLDVDVDEIRPGAVADADLALPARRTFAPVPPAAKVELPARFIGQTIVVDADVAGHTVSMVLDTGTASITLDVGAAGRWGFAPLFEHAVVPRMRVGGEEMNDVSVFTIPFSTRFADGILGYDYFFGHVVHVDYPRRRVEVLTHQAAESVFHDPKAAVLDMLVDAGLPLVAARIGSLEGKAFALDTGSPSLYVLSPFVKRFQAQIDREWSGARFPGGRAYRTVRYLEGSVEVTARQVPSVVLGPVRYTDVLVGVEVPASLPDELTSPFDGIIGTDELQHLDMWFDYDNERIALLPG